MESRVLMSYLLLLVCFPACKQAEQLERLNGKWQFIGFFEESVFQQDTLAVGFVEVSSVLDTLIDERIDVISSDTIINIIATDSGIWKVTSTTNGRVIAAEPNPYYVIIKKLFELTLLVS